MATSDRASTSNQTSSHTTSSHSDLDSSDVDSFIDFIDVDSIEVGPIDVDSINKDSINAIIIEEDVLSHENKTASTTFREIGPPSPHGGQYTAIPVSKSEKSLSSSASRLALFSPSTWLYEILSLSLAVVVLVGLIVVLAIYNKQPNPLWTAGITLNTIVSIASVLFRICLMVPVAKCISQLCWIWLSQAQRPLGDVILYDQASRGVFGSVNILFASSYGLYKSMVSIGAYATIVMLAVGPFFQQCVTFYSQRIPDKDSVAYASAAFEYKGSTGWKGLFGEQGERVPYNMKSAMYTGLLSSTMIARPDPPFSCPSGNCTWDPFATIAIGVRCIETPHRVKLNCSLSDMPDRPMYRPDECVIAWNTRRGIAPNDARFSIKPDPRELSTVFFFGSFYANWSSDLTVNTSGGRIDIDWIRATNLSMTKDLDTDSDWHYVSRNSIIESKLCSLYTSLHEVSARVENGVYTERLLREITIADDSSGAFTYEYISDHTAPVNFSITTEQQQTLLKGVNTLIPYDQNMSFGKFDELKGTDTSKLLYQTPNLKNSIYNLAHYMNIALRSNDTLLHSQTTEQENLSTGSTRYIAPSHRVQGAVYVDRIHVLVRWGWLALPIGLALLVLILLVATVVESQRRQVGIWKDSPLAMLLHSHWEPGLEPQGVGGRTADEIEQLVKGLRAGFIGGEKRTSEDIRKRILIQSS